MPDETLLEAAPPATPPTNPPGSPPATPPASTGYVSDNGNFNDGWLDRLPPDLKDGHQTLAKYRSLPELSKAHVELQKLLGSKSSAVNIPTEKSTPEEIAAYRKAIGAPEKPEDYKLKPEKLPDGIEWNPEFEKGITTIAAKHNIPAAAMKELSDYYLASEAGRGEEVKAMAQAELNNGIEALKTSWGANFEKNIGLATRVAQTVGLSKESPGLRDPEVVKALVRFGSMMSEDKLVSGEFSPSLQAGKARAKDIMTNKLNPLYDKYQKGDKETVETVTELLKHG